MTARRVRRCAQLIETLEVGGAERLAVRLANALAEAGHDSHLMVITGSGSLRRFVSPQVHVHELGFTRESVTRPHRFLGSLITGRALIGGALRREGIEIVQTHLPGANFWGLLLAGRGGPAILATVHNNQEFRYGDCDNPVRARARRFAYGALVRRCAATVAVSADVKASLVRDLGLDPRRASRIVVIRNGVPVPVLPLDGERDELRTRHGLPAEAFVFLAAGRFCEQKNFGELIRAASLLGAAQSPWRLVIAGDGPERAPLQTLVAGSKLSGNVSLPGNVLDLPSLMMAADAFVMPSLWEGLPLALLEAMACALPVVGTRIPGIAEVVRQDVEGLLVEPQDTIGLAGAMDALRAQPARARAMGRAARETVCREFDFARTVEELLELYATL